MRWWMRCVPSMGDSYSWLKTLHILAVLSWMAGLFYLPRLFVYHAESGKKSDIGETFKVMERRLLKAIMRPAAVVTVLSGSALIWVAGYYDPVPTWLWLKLAAIIGMICVHGLLERHAVRFRTEQETASGRYFRILNEVPTLLAIIIVIAVVVKPF